MSKGYLNSAIGWPSANQAEPELHLEWPEKRPQEEEEHWRRQNHVPLESAQEKIQRLSPGFDLKRLMF